MINETTGNHQDSASERDFRILKRQQLIDKGINPYAFRFDRSHYLGFISKRSKEFLDRQEKLAVCGKIYAIRTHGGSIFLDIADMSDKMQIYAKKDQLGDNVFQMLQDYIGLGDYVGVHGKLFVTKKGELSIMAEKIELLSKALRPLQSEWYGFKDTEKRFRQRYLDLLLNPETRERFKKRTKIVDAIRENLKAKDFLEIETPVLHPMYGGANAKPFKTHYESLKRDYYLRISNELYLKRAIIGNLEKVFEFSRDFRNEGIDTTHNPEFTMIEIYEAYKDYNDFMDLTKELILAANSASGNSLAITWGNKKIDLSGHWEKSSMSELLKQHAGTDILAKNRQELLDYAESERLDVPKDLVRGALIDKIFSNKVEPHLINPIFVIDYPLDISPLSKRHRNNPNLVERFELYIGGKEIANGFSELNDPIDQRDRFIGQQENQQKGDEEAHPVDEDFLTAMEYGMPPTVGVGIGIDRLTMLLTNAVAIKEAIMFPQLKSLDD